MRRYLSESLLTDPLANHKMAFLSGARQCGKTTLARSLLESENTPRNYFSWDDDDFKVRWLKDRKQILADLQRSDKNPAPLIVFDELHKYKKWKNSLKGFYDLYSKELRIIVTGSARMDLYRKSGDSMAGRYLPYRLHPFSLGEIGTLKPPPIRDWIQPEQSHMRETYGVADLMRLGPFPEPLHQGNEAKAIRWWNAYRERLVGEDLRDFKEFRNIQLVGALANLLRDRIGGTLSIQSLQEDLKVAFATAKDWVSALESLYFCFTLRPYSKRIQGSLQKEPKLYFYHWPAAREEGPKFENLIASHLLKNVHAWTDAALGEFELFYLRDKAKREVDFCVTRAGKPWLLVEVKLSATQVPDSLRYFTELLRPEHSFLVTLDGAHRKVPYGDGRQFIECLSSARFLKVLN